MRISAALGAVAWIMVLAAGSGPGAMAQDSAASTPKELHLAAAADLRPVMPVLGDLYQKKTGVKLVVSFGSSGTLTTQILNGAPFDIFLGADFVHPEQVVAAGLTDSTTPTRYAEGTLVVWVRNDSPLKPLSMGKLNDSRVQKIAIANEEQAPFGRAAVEALKQLQLYDQVKPRLVVAENVAQAAEFVATGNAQIGFISLTLASSQHYRAMGRYAVVPKVYPAIHQCGVILKASKNQAEARAFMEWLLSSPIQSNLHNIGLEAVR